MTWDRFRALLFVDEALTLDISRMRFTDGQLADLEPGLQRAYAEMVDLERGAIANPDENRMVGHYWLRDPARPRRPRSALPIETTLRRIKDFAAAVHGGAIAGERSVFRRLLVVGVGGSALGPQLASARSPARTTACGRSSSTTPIPTASISCSPSSTDTSTRP
jgi:glucose-6-phosphate isomerase